MSWKVETKKGQRSPPPLPMYERVVLKHVPTMVRRRYDKDLNIVHENNQGLPSKDGNNGVEDLDDSFEDETNASLDIEHDSQFFEENFDGGIIESSTGLSSKDCEDDEDIGAKDLVRFADANVGIEVHEVEQDCKSKREGAKDGNAASYYMNVSVQGEIQDKEHENFEYKQERKDEDDGANDVNVAYYVDTCFKNEVQDNEQVFHAEDNKSKGDGSVASNFKDSIVEDDEFQDNQHGNYDNKQDATKGDHSPIPLPTYESVLLKHVPTFVVRRYDKDINKFDIHKFDASPGTKDENDGANDVTVAYYGDMSVKSKFHQDNEEGFHVEDNKSKGDGIEDGNVAKNYQGGIEDEVQDNQHVNFDNKQERLTVTFEKDAIKEDQSPTPLPMYEHVLLKHVPTIVVRRYEKDIHKFDASPGLVSQESKSKEGVEHSSNASSVDASVEDKVQVHGHAELDANDQDLISKDLSTTLERDGYDLYCPDCKQFVTRTLIFRRREDCQHYQTTCFSFLTSLFCCNRW